MTKTVIIALTVFLAIVLLLVSLLLWAGRKLTAHGKVNITINDGQKIEADGGNTLIATLAQHDIRLASACGGKGSCGQCRCRVTKGGGDILPTERGFFTRKEVAQGWRLGCQLKIKEDLSIAVPQSILDVKEYECTVVSNRNVATFIKELKVQLPAGQHMDFEPGSYAQIQIPRFDISYDSFDRDLIGPDYVKTWEQTGLFALRCVNNEPTVRAYSMANYPAEGDVFMLTVRIATPPLKTDRTGFQKVSPGIASSYIFSLKKGDKVKISGPYGEFHLTGTAAPTPERLWIGGGAGMAPLRAQIMHLTRTMDVRDGVMHYFYGARALNEVFYLDDFLALERDFANFHFHLALDKPDPAADKAGVPYTAGFVHNVMYDTYLKDHPAPEDIEYYLCGPPMMSAAVTALLDNLGVEPESIHFDNFG